MRLRKTETVVQIQQRFGWPIVYDDATKYLKDLLVEFSLWTVYFDSRIAVSTIQNRRGARHEVQSWLVAISFLRHIGMFKGRVLR